MKKYFLMVLVSVVAIAQSQNTGTLDLSDIEDVLEQNKLIWGHVKSDFDIFPTGVGRMINRTESAKLNGARIGPYSFVAKPKGTSGPYTYDVWIETSATFVDGQGRRVAMSDASDFKEELLSIAIRPLSPEKYFTPVSDQKR